MAKIKYYEIETTMNKYPDAHYYVVLGERSNGKTYTTPAKMASIASSSAMTFNLLGNHRANIIQNPFLPCGFPWL